MPGARMPIHAVDCTRSNWAGLIIARSRNECKFCSVSASRHLHSGSFPGCKPGEAGEVAEALRGAGYEEAR